MVYKLKDKGNQINSKGVSMVKVNTFLHYKKKAKLKKK
jgi:hypothetical protein